MKLFRSLGTLLFGWLLFTAAAHAEQPSLQMLVDQTPAKGVLKLENKTYKGNVIISKPITILGADRSVLQGDGTGNVVTIQSSGVRLENLTITGSSFNRNSEEEYAAVKVQANHNVLRNLTITDSYHGVYLSQAHQNEIRNVHVTGRGGGEIAGQGNGIMVYYSNGNKIINNRISRTRDGMFFDYSNDNTVSGNEISDTRYGLHYMYSDRNHLTANKFYHNTGGAALMHSRRITLKNNQFFLHQGTRAFGVMLQSCDDSEIAGNQFFQNQRALYIDQSMRNRVKDNDIFQNQVGVELWASSTEHTFSGNRFAKNTVPVVMIGGEAKNTWSENGAGNDWGDEFRQLDLDQNGIGDHPMEYRSALYKLIEENELVHLFLNSPAIGIYELIGKFVYQQKSMLEDPHPLVARQTGMDSAWLLGLASAVFLGAVQYRRSRRIDR